MTAFARWRFAAAKAASMSLSVLAAITCSCQGVCSRRLLSGVPLLGDFRALRVDDQYDDGHIRN